MGEGAETEPYRILKDSCSHVKLVSQPKEIHALEVLYIDFMTVIYQNGKSRVHIMPILDHQSKLVVRHALGAGANT
jgi:hypothetical protein